MERLSHPSGLFFDPKLKLDEDRFQLKCYWGRDFFFVLVPSTVLVTWSLYKKKQRKKMIIPLQPRNISTGCDDTRRYGKICGCVVGCATQRRTPKRTSSLKGRKMANALAKSATRTRYANEKPSHALAFSFAISFCLV